MRRYAALLIGLVLAVPAAGFAQVQAGGTLPICSVTRTLLRGSRGNDVSILQAFLREQEYLKAAPTGFFGSLTAQALIQFQLKKAIVGRAADGGAYGPLTRNFVKVNWCLTPATRQTPAVAACLNPPRPTLSCDGTWQQFFDTAGCHTGWTCVVSTQNQTATATNKPPLISAIVGPTNIKSGDSGTWNITASDPENDQLTYSVVWGDEGANVATLLNISQEGTPYAASTAITHKYANTGSYTIVVFAKDTGGNIVKATLAVTIYEPAPPVVSNTSSGAVSETGTGKIYACYMNGQGFDVEVRPTSCPASQSYADAKPVSTECQKYVDGKTPLCTDQGWANIQWGLGYLSAHNITVGCTSHNGISIPGNMRVSGNRCIAQGTDLGQVSCDAQFICKRDGWWRIDSAGFELERVSYSPWVAPETFYPY